MNESRLGPFSLEERLGTPESTVHRAIHLEQRRQVVLKVFTVPFGATEHAGAEFVSEMALLRRLQHPSAARCYGGKIEGNVGYIASELIDGETLADVIERRGRLPWDQALEYAESIASALHAAHALGLAHQDLTPDKLLLAKTGLKVTDFRRDRVSNPWCFSSRKKTLARLSYLAPEQLRGETHLTAKADLYSLGAILFHMLAGRPPLEADSTGALGELRLAATAPRVSTIAMDCPIWLDVLTAQLLEIDPARRPHSAEAVGLALAEAKKKATAGTSVAQHALGGFSSLRMPADKQEVRKLVAGRRARRDESAHEGTPFWERPWFLGIALTGLLLVLGTALTYSLRPMSEQQLIQEAESLMASENPVDWRRAEDSYLQPLLKRFPKSDYVPKAREHLDTIAMHQAQQHLRTLQRLGRTPTKEGERLFAEAQRYEQFGDRVTALDKYQGMVNVLDPQGEDRPFVLLAKRQMAAILASHSETADAREKLIVDKLAEADALAERGKAFEARKIWDGLEALYGHNAELSPLIEQAKSRLQGTAVADGAVADGAVADDKAEPAAAADLPPAVKPTAVRKKAG